MKKKIPVFDIKLNKSEKKYALECLKTSQIGQGRFIKKFENKFSKYVNCKYGVTTTSGTTALHLACSTLNLKKNDEVLISSSTNMACAFSVEYCGAIPVPIDIEMNTWQLNVQDLEKKITKKTKAIMVVHLFGQAVDMDPVLKIAKKYKLKIIEDCAESHGVEYKGRKVGSMGDIGVFSFFSNKTITCGEGGMIVTNNKKLAVRASILKNLAYGKKNRFMHSDIGFNYRLSNLSAAIGLGQLENINSKLKEKKRIYLRYKKKLKNIKGIKIPVIKKYTTNFIMWVFNVYLDKNFPISRDKLIKILDKNGVETRNAFVPINKQKVLRQKYKIYKKYNCVNANYIMKKGFYLPSGNNITNKQIDKICKIISDTAS